MVMTTVQQIKDYVAATQARANNAPGFIPIYQIMVFTNPDKELMYTRPVNNQPTPSGFPDIGANDIIGFYYDLEDAIHALNTNSCDIQESCYHAAFILVKFPGLYETCGYWARMYFLWDETKKGFFQTEEPDIFAHIAY